MADFKETRWADKAEEHHDTLDPLQGQLTALTEIGFNSVDCFYKYGIFAVYGGEK